MSVLAERRDSALIMHFLRLYSAPTAVKNSAESIGTIVERKVLYGGAEQGWRIKTSATQEPSARKP